MNLWAWGANSHGQLGLGIITEQVQEPTKVVLSQFCNKIKQISCGGGHTLLLNDEDNRKVKDVALGSEHTICLSEDNTLWAWGWNEHANTGISLEPVISFPTIVPIKFNKDEIITQIYAGGAHNFIVTNINKNDDSEEKL
ncbi:unnamed protein product [Parnassius apollo]|uniref:(apollo) hypothetical protein n=1 Tax=Parnassius apollo TaxID=110799 RepID=A0A8S3X471_PARAO|nr:unnamed protein product [Parnassius apollo]